MYRRISSVRLVYLALFLWGSFTLPVFTQGEQNPLQGKIICLDPGHGGTADTDQYRVGPNGEREEWINLRVGLALRALLKREGATVVMTRTEDTEVTLSERARIAVEQQADVFVSIHHNATADSSVNFPIIYFHGNASENQAGVMLGELLIERLSEKLYDNKVPASLVSDHVIFPERGASVLRGTYGIPAVLAEASFFTNPEEEQRLKSPDYNLREAQAYMEALQSFFSRKIPPVYNTGSRANVKPFEVLQEADRMKPVARKWKLNFSEGLQRYRKGDTPSLQKALELFTVSARSFPDSWLARQAHRYRTDIFETLGKFDKQRETETRVGEYYIPLEQNEVFLNAFEEETIGRR